MGKTPVAGKIPVAHLRPSPHRTTDAAAGKQADTPTSIPALDRAFAVLQALFDAPDGLSPRALVERTGMPRTSLYRTLELLADREYAAVAPDGNAYVLGPTLLRLASRVPLRDDLASRAQPALRKLVAQFNETAKIVVRDQLESMAIAVIHPRVDARITSFIGSRSPLYVGPSQRLLLSRAPQDVIDAILAQPLRSFATRTITKPEALRRNLRELARRDWEFGRDEGSEGIGGVAALIREHGHPPRAVITMVFVASGKSEGEIAVIRDAVRDAAESLSTA